MRVFLPELKGNFSDDEFSNFFLLSTPSALFLCPFLLLLSQVLFLCDFQLFLEIKNGLADLQLLFHGQFPSILQAFHQSHQTFILLHGSS